MKKIKIVIICIFIVIFFASCTEDTLTFSLENITKIELRGINTVTITDQEKIQALIQPFNDNEFIKYKSSEDDNGFNIYWLLFYQDDKIITELIAKSDMIKYSGSFYHIKDGEINAEYFAELLDEPYNKVYDDDELWEVDNYE